MIIKARYFLINCILHLMILGLFSTIGCTSSNQDVAQKDSLSLSELKADEVLIEYIAHASFKLHNNGITILLDPFADSVWIGYNFPKNIKADAIFSTHPHYDHDGGIFRNLHPYWEGKIPFYQDPGQHSIGSFKMEGIKGRHCDPYGKEFGQRNTIWIFEVAGLRITHWGDNAPMNDTIAQALTNIDILMVPIDDTYHILKEEELKEVLDRLEASLVIPMHYKIAALEKRPGLPKNLGTIENYMKDKKQAIHLKGNKYVVSKKLLPEQSKYLVFQHSPDIITPK